MIALNGQWNRVSWSRSDETDEEVVVPGGDLSLEAHGIPGWGSSHDIVSNVFDSREIGWGMHCADNYGASPLNALISRAVGFGPRFSGDSTRPVCFSIAAIQSALPIGRPDVSDCRSARQAP